MINTKQLQLYKHLFTLLHIEALIVSFWILFFNGLDGLITNNTNSDKLRLYIVGIVQIIYFFRYAFANYYIRKNASMFHAMSKFPWAEPLFALVMFNLIHVGAAIATVSFYSSFGIWSLIGFLIYLIGSYIVVQSEFGRFRWKQDPSNKGKLYTLGLFQYSIHINYFGEWLLIGSYFFLAFSGSLWFILIVVIDFLDLYMGNVPELDNYLLSKYGNEFEEYRSNTKRFIPFLL